MFVSRTVRTHLSRTGLQNTFSKELVGYQLPPRREELRLLLPLRPLELDRLPLDREALPLERLPLDREALPLERELLLGREALLLGLDVLLGRDALLVGLCVVVRALPDERVDEDGRVALVGVRLEEGRVALELERAEEDDRVVAVREVAGRVPPAV